MRRCVKCIMPETKPGITFDDTGICNACRNAEEADRVDWKAKRCELGKLAEAAIEKKPKGYNATVAVSGGKDSVVMAVTIRDLGLTPLLVCAEPAYCTELGRRNQDNLGRLGFDTFVFKPNKSILPPLLLDSFIKEGQPVRAFEFILCSVPMQVATAYGTPLVVWGEDAQFMYGNPGPDGIEGDAMRRSHTCVMRGEGKERWSDIVPENCLTAYEHPTEEEMREAGVQAIYLSHYIPWNSRLHAKAAIDRGLEVRLGHEVWHSGGYWAFEQLDDEVPVISHLIKYIKFGYGRATDQACRDIRWGHIGREEGLALAHIYDGSISPDYIRRFCEFIGISWERFWEIAWSHQGEELWKTWKESPQEHRFRPTWKGGSPVRTHP